MAPGANSNSSTKVFVALAILLVIATATTVHGAKEDGLIQRVDDESLPAGSCICYDRCSGRDGLMAVDSQTCFVDCVLRHGCVCPSGAAIGGDGDRGGAEYGLIQQVGDEPLPAGSCLCYESCSGRDGLMDVDSQTCFINCVLRHGCVCPSGAAIGGDGDRGGAETTDADDAAAADDDGAPPPSPLPATLDKTLKVTVARPKVSRSRQEKRRAEEALLIMVDVVGYGSVKFEVLVNDVYLDDFYALPGEGTANAYPLSRFLEEDIRADGDKTVVVSLVPRIQGKRVTVHDVRIVYQDK